MKYKYPWTIKDRDRSSFGLGWEYRRRGRGVNSNPFTDPFRRHQFDMGYASFVDKEYREYLEQKIK